MSKVTQIHPKFHFALNLSSKSAIIFEKNATHQKGNL